MDTSGAANADEGAAMNGGDKEAEAEGGASKSGDACQMEEHKPNGKEVGTEETTNEEQKNEIAESTK